MGSGGPGPACADEGALSRPDAETGLEAESRERDNPDGDKDDPGSAWALAATLDATRSASACEGLVGASCLLLLTCIMNPTPAGLAFSIVTLSLLAFWGLLTHPSVHKNVPILLAIAERRPSLCRCLRSTLALLFFGMWLAAAILFTSVQPFTEPGVGYFTSWLGLWCATAFAAELAQPS